MTDAPVVTDTVVVQLSAEELSLVKAALRLLRSTLGREEAEELEEVQALLARLEQPEPER